MDTDPYTASTLTIGIGVAATRTQILDFNPSPSSTTSYATTIAANTPITIKFRLPAGLVSALGNVSISAVTNLHQTLGAWTYTDVGTAYTGSSLVGLIAASGIVEYTITPTAAFQGIRISITGLASVSASIDVYDAYVKVPAGSNIVCSNIADILYGAKAGTVVGGIANATGGVTNYLNGADNSASTYTTLTTGAQVLSQVYYTTVFNTPSKIGDTIKLMIQDASLALLNVSALAGMQINLYNGSSSSTPVQTIANNSTLLTLNLLNSSTNVMEIAVVPTAVFDRVELQLGGVAAALQSIRVYEVTRLNAGVSLTAAQADLYRYVGQSFSLAATSIATGDSVAYYDAASGGNLVTATTNIVTTAAQAGTVLHYYAGTTRNGCSESSGRKAINVSVINFSANTPVSGTVNTVYNSSVAITPISSGMLPNTPVYHYTSSTLPPGVSLNSSTGALTGTPTSVNSYIMVDTVDDTANGLRVGVFTNNIVINDVPLSINLISFDAFFSPEKKAAVIRWQVASDEQNESFEIERSADGRNFRKIGAVAFEKGLSSYTFEDFGPLPENYYRLKITEASGGIRYSKTAYVKSGVRNANVVLYPSPTNGKDITAAGDIAGINVINSMGQDVGAKVNYGKGYAIIATSSLSKGIYFIRVLCTNGAVNTFQVINN